MGLDYVGEFVARLKDFVDNEIPREFKRRQVETIMFLYSRLVYYTPVRTGHARANWRVSAFRIREGVLKTRGTKERPADTISTESIRQNLTNMVQGDKSSQGISQPIWVYNNVHYIQALEDGHTVDPSKGYMVLRATADTLDFMATMQWGFGGSGKVMTVRQYIQSRGD